VRDTQAALNLSASGRFPVQTFSVTVDIQAPPDRVLAVLIDVERWPDWTSSVTSVQRLDGGRFIMGSRARIRQPKLRPAVWQVTQLDQRSFTWSTRSPGLQVTGLHQIEENGTGSRVTLSIQFSGLLAPLLARIYGGLNERYLAIEAQGLKARSEGTNLSSPALT
jgi:uncharacterized membrane protein